MEVKELLNVRDQTGPRRALEGVWLAKVTKATATKLHFELVTEDGLFATYEFGPAPYQTRLQVHRHGLPGVDETDDTAQSDPPVKGTRCAVAFAEGDPDRPLVLAVYW